VLFAAAMARKRILALLTVLLALLAATWQRARAVEKLPPDFDEGISLPLAYRYAEMLAGRPGGDPSSSLESIRLHPGVLRG